MYLNRKIYFLTNRPTTDMDERTHRHTGHWSGRQTDGLTTATAIQFTVEKAKMKRNEKCRSMRRREEKHVRKNSKTIHSFQRFSCLRALNVNGSILLNSIRKFRKTKAKILRKHFQKNATKATKPTDYCDENNRTSSRKIQKKKNNGRFNHKKKLKRLKQHVPFFAFQMIKK